MGISTFSSISAYSLDVDAQLVGQNPGAKISTIYWRMIVRKGNTYGHTATGNTGSSGSVNSNVGALWSNGNMSFNFQNGGVGGEFLIADGRFDVRHRPDGGAEYQVTGTMDLAMLGHASATTGVRSLPRLANLPDAPTPIGFTNITQTAITFRFSGNGDGGSPILEWQALYQEAPNGPQISYRSNGFTPLGGFKPGTTYNFWARGRNAVGWGPWSRVISTRTLAGMRVKYAGSWREAVPYVKVNGVWRIASPYVRDKGTWKKSV
jgi:hypothetical protein